MLIAVAVPVAIVIVVSLLASYVIWRWIKSRKEEKTKTKDVSDNYPGKIGTDIGPHDVKIEVIKTPRNYWKNTEGYIIYKQ